MPDREKVIDSVKTAFEIWIDEYDGCSWFEKDKVEKEKEDALSLLKEQEAVKPRVSNVEQRCGNCNKVIEMDGWITCPWCGKPILWEAVGRSVKWE